MSGLRRFWSRAGLLSAFLGFATTLAVASLLLLDLKATLEKLATTIAPNEIFYFAKFLLC